MSRRKVQNEQSIPPEAMRDPDSVEVLRVWMTSEGMKNGMELGVWEERLGIPDLDCWGLMIAETLLRFASAGDSENAGLFAREAWRILESELERRLSGLPDDPTT